jgi:hypothetical protein
MTARARWAGALATIAVLVVGLLAALGDLRPSGAIAVLGLSNPSGVPYALVRPLWTDALSGTASPLPVSADGRERARAALRIIRSAQADGVLRGVLGPRPARVVQLGDLQDRGRTVGATALLALPVPRQNVRATVPGVVAASPGLRIAPVRFTAPVLRDVLVDVDLRRGEIVAVQPGPASRTSAWSAAVSPSPPSATVAAANGTPPLVRLSPDGPSFAAYDGTPALGPAGRGWPVSLIFAGHATMGKVKHALRSIGFTHLGERRWLAYGAPAGAVRFDSDRGLKTACDANGTDVHLRLYAPPQTNHFTDPRYGNVIVATVHLDRGESCAAPPQLFGFSEEAERRVGDAVASGLGWRVQPDRVALGNAEPYRRDLAAPDHLWWSDGRATLISVP